MTDNKFPVVITNKKYIAPGKVKKTFEKIMGPRLLMFSNGSF